MQAAGGGQVKAAGLADGGPHGGAAQGFFQAPEHAGLIGGAHQQQVLRPQPQRGEAGGEQGIVMAGAQAPHHRPPPGGGAPRQKGGEGGSGAPPAGVAADHFVHAAKRQAAGGQGTIQRPIPEPPRKDRPASAPLHPRKSGAQIGDGGFLGLGRTRHGGDPGF